MTKPEGVEQEVLALRERLSRLSEASLRINESLEFDTVLQEVLDSARALTGARYGVITLFDAAGGVGAYLASGLSPEGARRLWEMPERRRFFDYLHNLPGPLRVPDFASHASSVGLPEFRPPADMGALLAVPIRHRAKSVGNVYLAKETSDSAFTSEDEETLVTFASQAALVIVNAQRYQDEQRARNDLEAVVSTAPVGVVVLDARTGELASTNREAQRIVSVIQDSGQPPEELLKLLTIRRTDGREVSLEEMPLTEVLSTAEMVRAKEVVLQVPDGRSVTTLVNVTPIRSADDEMVSVVVTLQDLTPLEDLERLRSEFLGMVSHEMQIPLTSIKGSTAALLEHESNLDPAEARQFYRIIDDQADHMRDLMGDLLDVARIETGTLSVAPRAVAVAELVDEAKNRFLRAGTGHELQIELAPDLPPVLADQRRIVQVIGNLLSNAARYSPDLSAIRVTAGWEGGHVAISIMDEGMGLPAEQVPQVFGKFSRLDGQERRRDLGGSGLGLAICKGIVEAHGGRIRAESEGPDLGSRFTFTLPVDGDATLPASPRPSQSWQPTSEKIRILAVDDDPQALRYVREVLSRAGYAPIVTGDPEAVTRLVEEEKPQLVLLDLMLPGTDGIALMRTILEITDVPVVFLSVYGQDDIIVRAFDMGAADYVVKPFSPTELAARIRAALRRRIPPALPEPTEPYLLEDLALNFVERRVTIAGEPVDLTATEYRLLVELAANAGRVMTHDQLLERVWGTGRSGGSAPVRNIVARLRRKLKDDATAPTYIFSESRVGYRMAKPQA